MTFESPYPDLPTKERKLAQIAVDALMGAKFLDAKTVDFVGAIDALEKEFKWQVDVGLMKLEMFIQD